MSVDLINAVKSGKLSEVDKALNVPYIRANAFKDGNQALFESVKMDHNDIANRLLDLPCVTGRILSMNNPIVLETIAKGNFIIFGRLFNILEMKNKHVELNINIIELAAQAGNPSIFNLLLRVIINTKAYSLLNTALRNASLHGNIDIVKRLYEYNEIREADTKDGYLGLHHAIVGGHLNIVEYFMNIQRINLNLTLDELFNLLHKAISFNRYNIIKLLVNRINNQYDCNFDLPSRYKILIMALQAKDYEGADIIFAHRGIQEHIIKNAQDTDILFYAAENGHLELVKRLLDIPEIRRNAHKNRNAALQLSLKNGHEEIASILLTNQNVKENACGSQCDALISAAERGFTNIVKILLSLNKAQPNAQNNLAIRNAVANNHLQIVEALIKHQSVLYSITKDNNALLLQAVKNNNTAMVKLLLSVEKVKSLAHEPSNKVFITAISNKNIEIITELLSIPNVRRTISRQFEAINSWYSHQELLDIVLACNSIPFKIKDEHPGIWEFLLFIEDISETIRNQNDCKLFLSALRTNDIPTISKYLNHTYFVKQNLKSLEDSLFILIEMGRLELFITLLNKIRHLTDLTKIRTKDRHTLQYEEMNLPEIALILNINIYNYLHSVPAIANCMPSVDYVSCLYESLRDGQYANAREILKLIIQNGLTEKLACTKFLRLFVDCTDLYVFEKLLKNERIASVFLRKYPIIVNDAQCLIHDFICEKGLSAAEHILSNPVIQRGLPEKTDLLLSLFKHTIKYLYTINPPEEFLDQQGNIAGTTRRKPNATELNVLQWLLNVLPFSENELMTKLPPDHHDTLKFYCPFFKATLPNPHPLSPLETNYSEYSSIVPGFLPAYVHSINRLNTTLADTSNIPILPPITLLTRKQNSFPVA